MNSNKEHWILCPACGSKTRARLLPDTVLRSFPLFCPKCRRESMRQFWFYLMSGGIILKIVVMEVARFLLR